MRFVAIILTAVFWFGTAEAQERAITVASTTSTEQSGLFGYLLPQFSKTEGINVKVVAVGTGQALDIGRRGDADVVFVHDRPAEDKFMAEGQTIKLLGANAASRCAFPGCGALLCTPESGSAAPYTIGEMAHILRET